ncbi:MAG: hypothetical protein LBD14_00325 [Puniceicoccales bacterium]|nr:hypothetical protein [Puniceicoccales bacterium]
MAGTALGFYGRADRVLSVSFQEYTTGPLVVSEVVIDLEGANQLLRLYSARPVSPEEMARRSYEGVAAGAAEGTDMAAPPAEILPSSGGATAKLEAGGRAAVEKFNAGLVVKTYPVTTHAKTAEFSVSSRKELLAFYNSFRSLCTNKPVAVKADGSPGGGGAGETQVLSLGGTLFTLE